MKLRNKVLLILGIGLVSLSTSFYLISRILLLKDYTALEDQKVSQDVERIIADITEETETVSRSTLDYSKWDETYKFIDDKNKNYLESNLASYIDALEMNAIVFVDSSGKVVAALGADLTKAQPAPVSQFLLAQLTASSPLLHHTTPDSQVTGILQLPEGPMLIASRPIVTSDNKGPIRGTLLMGRYLNTHIIKELSVHTKLPIFTLFSINQLPPDFQQAYQTLSQRKLSITVQPLTERSIAGYGILNDISGQPAYLIRIVEARSIYGQAKASANYLIVAILLTGSLFSIAIILFLEKIVLSRLSRFSTDVAQIGTGGISNKRLSLPGGDELSDLAITFNAVLDQLQQFQLSLQSNAERLQHQNAIIADLSHNESLLQGNVKQAARMFTQIACETLEVDRFSIWLYTTDQSKMVCLDLYERSSERHAGAPDLQVAEFPRYFAALTNDGMISAANAQTDPHTIELAEPYLIPLNIASVLHFPIQSAGHTVGMVCGEQVGTQRAWQPAEQTFIYSIANLVALALESETLQAEVGHILEVVSAIEDGDLTTQAQVSDRITGLVADVFNRLTERLADILSQVLQAARQVSEAANQQKELATTVAINAEQQAQAVNQVLHLSEQVEQAAQGSAERTATSTVSLQTVSETVIQGQEMITGMTQGIHVLQEGSNRIMQQMKTLGEFVGLADQFVQDQSQIAFITQTLSLNASLVAARASEQRDPRQFVVVAREFDSIADQVNKLAQQTNEGLIKLEQRSAQIHKVVTTIDADVQQLGELVRGFTQGVEQSRHVFSNVQTVTEEAMQAGEAVAHFSQTIVEASQTTAQVMRDIAGLATKTAELTQLSQERSDQIDVLSTQLFETVQFFQLPAVQESAAESDRLAALPSKEHSPDAVISA